MTIQRVRIKPGKGLAAPAGVEPLPKITQSIPREGCKTELEIQKAIGKGWGRGAIYMQGKEGTGGKVNICAKGRSWQGLRGWNKHPDKMAG